MTKHTPGPWEVEIQIGPLFHVMTRNGDAIADMAVEYSSINEDSEHEANARLIAAAPELLDALISARNTLAAALRAAAPDLFTTDEDIAEHLTIRKIDDAIAKATGGQL